MSAPKLMSSSFVRAENPFEEVAVTVGGADGAAKRDAVENAFAGDGVAGTVEEFAERIGVSGREGRIFFQRERDDGLDVFGVAARIGDELAGDGGGFARSHVIVARGDDGGFLLFGERSFFEDLVVPEEVGVERSAAMRGYRGDDAVVVFGVALRFLQALLSAGGATVEIGELRGFSVVGGDDLFGGDRHEVGGAIAEVFPDLGIADAGVGVGGGAHVGRGGRHNRRRRDGPGSWG
jgi:hypothetical protein